MNKLITTIAIFLLATNTQAQNLNNNNTLPFIEVTGHAVVEVVPDEIYIDITIREKYTKNGKLSIEIQEKNLQQALKSSGIDFKNIVTSASNASYVERKIKSGEVFAGKRYVVKAKSTMEAANLFLHLEKQAIDEASVTYTSHSQIDSIVQKVKIMALKATDEKADYLLTTVNCKKGKPLEISEMPNKTFGTNPTANTQQYYKNLASEKIAHVE